MTNCSLNQEVHIESKYDHWMVFDYERTFNYYEKRNFLKENLQIPILVNVLYVFTVFSLRRIMQWRQPLDLRKVLILWNVSLAAFSIVGSVRVTPFIVSFISKHGFADSCCVEPVVNGVYGFWVWLFILSKLAELGDTLFVVLRKQKLLFLHWFHHSTVLLFVWISNSEEFSIGGYFMVMNYSIHSFMYSYYVLKALGYQMSRYCAMAITASQLIQMVVGLLVTLYAFNEKLSERSCATSDLTIHISLVLYGVYLILFLNFFVRSYAQFLNPHKTAVCGAVNALTRRYMDYRNNNSKSKIQ